MAFGEFDENDWDIEKNTIVGPILFWIITIMLPLILINLVIAVMSDTF